MNLTRTISLSAKLMMLSVLCLSAVAQSDLQARLDKASESSSLDSLNERPWNLKLDLTIYDAEGKNPQSGTAEVWRSEGQRLEVFTFGTASYKRLDTGKATYDQGDMDSIPYRAIEALEQIMHPGPVHEDMENGSLTLTKRKFGSVSLDCMMIAPQIKDVGKLPLGLYPTFCLSGDTIRATYNFGSRTVVINGSGNFLNREIATKLDILYGSVVVAEAKLSHLSTYTPDPAQFLPTADMQSHAQQLARVSGGVMAGNILKKIPPEYPASARSNHVSGTVALHAIIGKDGHVHALRPISSPDPDLTLASIIAVRQWTYKPYLLNGIPTGVDTTITVNFNLSVR